MINLFLKAKHWHLFLLVFGIPVIAQMVMMAYIFSSMLRVIREQGQMPDAINTFSIMQIYFPIIMIFFMTVFFGWFWSIAIGLQKLIPQELTLKTGMFKLFLFIPCAYIIFFVCFFMSMTPALDPQPAAYGHIPWIFAIILPLHLFSMFCIFYCIYFVAKTFRTAELQREVTFNDYVAEFFLIWFYPVGVWLIQPRINKLAQRRADEILV